jgi:EpsI family protein
MRVLLPTSYLARVYEKNRRQLGLMVAFYAQQRAGESMHSPKACLPGAGWEIWQHGSARIPVNRGSIAVNRYGIQRAGQRMVVFYWYQSRKRIIASEYLGKLLLVRDAVWDGRTGGAIVRITLPDIPSANDEGVEFAAHLIPEVQRCLGR